jgi:hypothetical protein
MMLPEFLGMEFVAHEDSSEWVLLVEEGYLFTLMPESEDARSGPPFEVVEAAKTAFAPTVEFVDWVRHLRSVSEAGPHTLSR